MTGQAVLGRVEGVSGEDAASPLCGSMGQGTARAGAGCLCVCVCTCVGERAGPPHVCNACWGLRVQTHLHLCGRLGVSPWACAV